jgi:hypothetical protein
MHIQHALIADHADIVNGKLYLMGGGWDVYQASELPATIRMSITVGVRIGWEETNKRHPVNVFIEDDDGRVLAKIEGAMQVGRPANLPAGGSQLSQMAANLPLTVDRHGGYRVRVVAGEEGSQEEATVPFRVVPRGQPATP